MKKVLFSSIAAIFVAGAASAACTTPSANGTVNPSAPVLQMDSINGMGSLGPASSIPSFDGGQMYFDVSLSQMIWCDGTNWLRLDGTDAFNENPVTVQIAEVSGGAVSSIEGGYSEGSGEYDDVSKNIETGTFRPSFSTLYSYSRKGHHFISKDELRPGTFLIKVVGDRKLGGGETVFEYKTGFYIEYLNGSKTYYLNPGQYEVQIYNNAAIIDGVTVMNIKGIYPISTLFVDTIHLSTWERDKESYSTKTFFQPLIPILHSKARNM